MMPRENAHGKPGMQPCGGVSPSMYKALQAVPITDGRQNYMEEQERAMVDLQSLVATWLVPSDRALGARKA